MSLRMIQDWRGLDETLKGASVALGAFDGVHRGHRQVIADAARAAGALKAPLGVISFEPHPSRWFDPKREPFLLTTLAQRAQLLSDLGVDLFYVLPFDGRMANLSDEAFVREVLVDGLGVRHVSAGFDVTFGKGRSGSSEALKRYGEQFGFGVSITQPVADAAGGKCSSSVIRDHLRAGRPELAAEMLGRPFAVEGVVVHGDHLGRTIGFPTANIALEDYVRPEPGIYAMRTRLGDGREIPGVGYVGRRPTVNGLDERLEVFLFDFDEDIYGQTLEIDLVAFIRGDRKYDDLPTMVTQMNLDVQAAHAILTPEI